LALDELRQRKHGHTITDTVYAAQVGQLNAFSRGDRGGPVYTINSDGSVTARGMIYAQHSSAPSEGYYGKVGNILSTFSATLKTS
jgi:hypothetical protein